MAIDDKLEPNGEKGKRLTILSIDGGGVRGIIPAKILQKLEDYLKEEENKNDEESNKKTHHLWEYCDIIAGTSSGGLITAMITTPIDNDSPEPCFDAKGVVKFFQQDAVTIFPKKFT
jgi:patatin-like phospholipase/acyl hydrolase